MRSALRLLAFLVAIPFAFCGVFGVVLYQKGPALIEELRQKAIEAARENPDPASARESLEAVHDAFRTLERLPVLPLSAGLLVGGTAFQPKTFSVAKSR